MKLSNTLIAIPALAVAACGAGDGNADTDGDGEVSTEEMQAAVENADEIKPEAGQYRVEMTFVSAEGMPPEMQEMMAANGSQSYEYCVTEEMAQEGFAASLANEEDDDSCTYERMVIDGGDIDIAMSCNDDAGNLEMRMTMTGSVTPTSSEYTLTTEGLESEFGGGPVEMRVTQERIGDC